MHPTAIKLATFTAAALAVIGAFSIATDLLLRDKSRVRDRLQEYVGKKRGARGSKPELFRALAPQKSEETRFLFRIWARFVVLVEQSGVEAQPGTIMRIGFTLAIIAAVSGLTLTRHWTVALAACLAALCAPLAYLHFARKARIAKLCEQLPEAFELMSRAVKAGQTMPSAMNLVAAQLKPPISTEFGSCCDQQNLGLPQDVALQELARRTGVMELQMFIVAMLIQRHAGGNPIEILDNLSEVIRKRIRLLGKVKACTSEGRMQAVVLTILPLIAFAGLFLLNRTYVQVLLERPRLLAAMVASQLMGALWIRRIINFQY